MKDTVSKQDFIRRFEDFNRAEGMGGRRNLGFLYDYLVVLEENVGEELELDVIGICCEYDFYESLEEYLEDQYGDDYEDEGIDSVDDLGDITIVIEAPEGLYVQVY